MFFFGLQRCKDRTQHIKAYLFTRLHYHFAISKMANRCPYLLLARKSGKKHKKSHIFCLKVLPFQIKVVLLQCI